MFILDGWLCSKVRLVVLWSYCVFVEVINGKVGRGIGESGNVKDLLDFVIFLVIFLYIVVGDIYNLLIINYC